MAIDVYNANKIKVANAEGYIITSHNGRIGESVDVLVYLRNDSPIVYYDSITVSTIDSDGSDDTLGVYGTGRGIKLAPGSREPTEAEWDNILAGDFAEMPTIGTTLSADTTTYHPLWIRVIVPGNTPAQTFSDITLQIEASEHLVGT